MNQKKKMNMLVILIIIILIIILVGGVAFAYLATDLLKSDKELFFKYITQIADSEKGFIDNNINQYFEKKESTPYSNNGLIDVNITSENGQEQYESANNFNISFSGEIDKANSKISQNISLNYSDSVNFPISYKQINETVGLQTDYVGNKFIAVETNQLNNLSEDLATSVESTTSNMNKLQETTRIQLSEEEKNHINNTYMVSLEQQLNENNFSKVTESDLNGYRLTLTGEELKSVLTNLLETLKNDQTTLDKLNEYLKAQDSSNTITTADIDKTIESINNDSELAENQVEITVYSKSGKTAKLTIVIQDTTISIEKLIENNQPKINISYEKSGEEPIKITLGATFEGLTDMQTVKENYTIELQYQSNGAMTYQYQLNNEINFIESTNIEEFTANNTMILNNYEEVQVSNFLKEVEERIVEINRQQMEELGLEENENPIQYAIPIPSLVEYNQAQQAFNDSATKMNELEIQTFNNKFEMYAGTNQRGATVRGLLSTIALNNQSQDESRQITEINFCGEEYEASEQNIAFIKEDVDLGDKNYRIEFEKNQDTGVIYRVVINER